VADEAGTVMAVLDTVGTEDSLAATAELLQGNGRAVTTVPGEQSAAAGLAAVQQLEGRVVEVGTLAAEGQITFTISHRMPLIEAADALDICRMGHGRGKIMLLP
jgi:D-arabinose 1-dehydrogenase-like Zn-dependent alcohol dehydrogenase